MNNSIESGNNPESLLPQGAMFLTDLELKIFQITPSIDGLSSRETCANIYRGFLAIERKINKENNFTGTLNPDPNSFNYEKSYLTADSILLLKCDYDAVASFLPHYFHSIGNKKLEIIRIALSDTDLTHGSPNWVPGNSIWLAQLHNDLCISAKSTQYVDLNRQDEYCRRKASQILNSLVRGFKSPTVPEGFIGELFNDRFHGNLLFSWVTRQGIDWFLRHDFIKRYRPFLPDFGPVSFEALKEVFESYS